MDLDSSSLKGFELGKLVLSSGLLHSSWSKISEIHKSNRPNQPSGIGIKIYQEDKYTLVVFDATPIRENCSVNSAPTLLSVSQDQNPFHFLCSERISSFSLHTPAFKLFDSAYKKLSRLKSELLHELETKKSVIITGAALGGSVASLFTLWLLETIEPKLKRPLCITFGSPLIGDASLQQILDHSVWNSCFLHVADAAAQPPPVTAGFKPFGTFLICFDSQCICIENPEAVMELLTGGTNTDPLGWRDYGEVLQRLDKSSVADSRLMIDDDGVISRMEERAANKKLRFDQLKKLNDMKISMMYIEWYKKTSKEENIGYYDRFKNRIASPFDIDVEKRKRELNEYWKSMVEEVEKKPQSEKSNLKTRCLFSGNNFRRMIEPLDIAEYYLGGGREYRASGRSRHYVMLEKWFKEEKIEPDRCEKRDLTHFLTFDSCFWAEVEDAMIAVNDLKTKVGMRDEALTTRLEKFEGYVWGMIGKREVSPEIFLEKSSFMKWWREYKEMRERRDGFSNSSASGFTEFMNTRRYETYGRQFAGEK
uniref:Senescence-associated carboxylesterase 101 n=1 Tax=Noccaea caerulescens TaxID=107243 RepID=A0A1J3HTH5_NOCCA